MTRGPRRATFAAVLRTLPPVTVTRERVEPGRISGATAVDPSGKSFSAVDGELCGAEVQQLVSQGALVAWDSCGCGGWCPDTSGASMSRWSAADGSSLVVLAGPVRWGRANRG